MDHVVYYLHVSINGYDAEVWLNDAPIIRSTTAYPCIAFPTVSEWVLQGENELKVVIASDAPPEGESPDEASGGEDTGARYPGPDLSPVRVKVSLCQGELGGLPDLQNEDVLCALDGSPSGGAASLPAVASVKHEVVTPYGRWSFQDAKRITLDGATMAEIEEVASAIHGSLRSRRIQPLADLMRVKFDEVGRCYDLTPEEAEAKMTMGFEELFEPEAWDVADFDPAELDPRLCCDGRVVELRNKDGGPTIRQREPLGDETWAMSIFLARVGGRFVIVR